MNNNIKTKKTKSQKVKDIQFWSNFEEWICYWRLNPHRFCTEYFGLNLYLFQKIVIYLMNFETIRNFMFWAQRGTSKSWITAVFCLERGTLYPGTRIAVAAPSLRQANMLIKKIESLKDDYPNIGREIKDFGTARDGAKVKLYNGSEIEAVVCGETGRGVRANILVMDEGRLLAKEKVDTILVPFLTFKREPGYFKNPKYRNYKEENKKIFLSSIGTKEEWSYKEFLQYYDNMTNGDDSYLTISLPYQFGVQAGVIDKRLIEEQAQSSKDTMETFKMEMEVIPFGEAETSMFKYDVLSRARKLSIPLIAPQDQDYFNCEGDYTKWPYYTKKIDGELRIMQMDIAVAQGRKNDNSVIMIFRIYQNGEHYDKELAYIETLNGVNLDQQMLRVKQLFYDLDCDYVIIDANGALGITACDILGQRTSDHGRGIVYPGWKTFDSNDKFDMRITDRNAEPVLCALQYGGLSASSFQYNMLAIQQLAFDRRQVILPQPFDDAIDILNKKYKYLKLATSNVQSEREIAFQIQSTFENTGKLIHEAVNTQVVKLPSGRYTFDEGNDRKDRAMCMIYGLYFINRLEKDLAIDNTHPDISAYAAPTSTNKRTQSTKQNPFGGRMDKLRGFGVRR